MSEICRICENATDNLLHTAREMMFGTRDEFEYLECGSCGTVQIVEIPDLSRYYPNDYYSLSDENSVGLSSSYKSRLAARVAGKYLATGHGSIGRYLSKKKDWIVDNFPKFLREPILALTFESKILDFGCGNGKLLLTLDYFGFKDLTGVDAFIGQDIVYPNGIKIYKRPLAQIATNFDLVMLHHSFEHLPDPVASLSQIHRILNPNKYCLIRIPLINYAWERYGVDWVQLDPPRHLFLYTEKSFRQLAESNGFAVEKVVYDSEIFQFFASEQYARDIAMNDQKAYRGVVEESIFTAEQLEQWQRETDELNASGKGDQACFYLRKI